jgi:hypothetical protein
MTVDHYYQLPSSNLSPHGIMNLRQPDHEPSVMTPLSIILITSTPHRVPSSNNSGRPAPNQASISLLTSNLTRNQQSAIERGYDFNAHAYNSSSIAETSWTAVCAHIAQQRTTCTLRSQSLISFSNVPTFRPYAKAS